MHKDVQEKTYNELMSVINEEDFDEGNLQKLEYFERVINETLRLFPTVPLNSRMCTEDIQFGKNKTNFLENYFSGILHKLT